MNRLGSFSNRLLERFIGPQKESSPTNGLGPLWLDARDGEAQAQMRARGLHSEVLAHGLELIRSGFTIVPEAVDGQTCRAAMDDFARYLRQHQEDSKGRTDALGRHYRFVNFHLASEAAMAIGMNERVLRILDFLFGYKAAVYTSLYFEYGTGQPIHRDSPFFHTFPINYFVGVWTALEDIHPDSGPLTYVPGGHRWEIDHQAIFKRIRNENPKQTQEWCVNQALQDYYGVVIKRAADSGAAVSLPLRRGDTAIWHGQAPHGGSPIVNKALTRTSIVFHCVPESVQVYHQDVFFTHPPSIQPPPRFDYSSRGNRMYANAGTPAFADTY